MVRIWARGVWRGVDSRTEFWGRAIGKKFAKLEEETGAACKKGGGFALKWYLSCVLLAFFLSGWGGMDRYRYWVGMLLVWCLGSGEYWVAGQERGEQERLKRAGALAQGRELQEGELKWLRLRVAHMMERDQAFRTYLVYETFDDEEVERLSKLELPALMVAMKEHRGKFSVEVKQVLNQLQAKHDRRNHEELVEIIKEYGYPSRQWLGEGAEDVFPLLLHPPVELAKIEAYLAEMTALLKPEVLAGRMEAKQYAVFVDNILGKILRRPQLYGTNEVFNSKTQTIDPPEIAHLEETNRARRELGLAELKEGEYRVVEQGAVGR